MLAPKEGLCFAQERKRPADARRKTSAGFGSTLTRRCLCPGHWTPARRKRATSSLLQMYESVGRFLGFSIGYWYVPDPVLFGGWIPIGAEVQGSATFADVIAVPGWDFDNYLVAGHDALAAQAGMDGEARSHV